MHLYAHVDPHLIVWVPQSAFPQPHRKPVVAAIQESTSVPFQDISLGFVLF
jgi:hypothetical protein